MPIRSATVALAIGLASAPVFAQTAGENQVLGTWRMVSATIDPDGQNIPAYGARPNGLLVFTPDMRFVEVLTDADTPRFASDARGEGTDDENRMAMTRGIGFFGTYTVDGKGEFSGNRVEGATFPNWVGSTRTREQLKLIVVGDRMTEHFQRPEGTRIRIEWTRVQ
ncbi:lipocalin-like domain-containing protein [Azospirillum sp. Vi22]|uniref:lipocalin-like domain-containing protein n=1 Tax=Azospirillum baldaniorum TaxID=1064539 RepID=UPI00119F9F23|nr:lipocalin-like domain-containing protein [Azospirillum baldaniorum]NUB08118.1 lipocalin-like domain-containing protein [Azospirillum baldaniorum]TWA61752.1 lipocalin-like protein [Azospirillum baldaniorum]